MPLPGHPGAILEVFMKGLLLENLVWNDDSPPQDTQACPVIMGEIPAYLKKRTMRLEVEGVEVDIYDLVAFPNLVFVASDYLYHKRIRDNKKSSEQFYKEAEANRAQEPLRS